jgi:hypothetical protein
MENVNKAINEIARSMVEGTALEAFEKYYHDEVVMQENAMEPTVGKDANRIREQKFFSDVTEFREATPLQITYDNNVSMVLWKLDYTHKDWGVRNYTQVSVQWWQDGKIVKEQFFYGA